MEAFFGFVIFAVVVGGIFYLVRGKNVGGGSKPGSDDSDAH